jgi:protein SSD1
MTDESAPQSQSPVKKDEKKTPVSNRGPKKGGQNTANTKTATGPFTQGPSRPSSRSNNKKSTSNIGVMESGSESSLRKPSERGKKPDQRSKNGGNRTGGQRKSSGSQGRSSKDQPPRLSNSPAPGAPQTKESDALSSLQRVIADLKTASPMQSQVSARTSSFTA